MTAVVKNAKRATCHSTDANAVAACVIQGWRVLRVVRHCDSTRATYFLPREAQADLDAFWVARDILRDAAAVALERGSTPRSPTDPDYDTRRIEHDEDEEANT